MNKVTHRSKSPFAAALFAISPVSPNHYQHQSGEHHGVTAAATAGGSFVLSGTGSVSPLGNATVTFTGFKDHRSGVDQGTFTFFFNRVE